MIRLTGISKHYGVAGRAVPALDGIDLEVHAGEILGIIGSSGAGKSTLVRLINLLERPTSGEIFIGERRTTALAGRDLRDLRRRIGMVFQHFNLLNARTVAANVAFPLQLAGGFDRKAIKARVDALLERVGLAAHADKYPRQLSGGQKQRVGIARALACSPQILLCDEATSALDPQTTRSVLDLLQEINRELGLTIVLITHEMDVIRQSCDRVAVIDAGRIVEEGPVSRVFLHPSHPATLRLVREAEHDGGDTDPGLTGGSTGPLFRLTFLGETAHRPILGRIAAETGVDYAILGGRVGRIRQTPYAQLTVALVGGNSAAAIGRLTAAGVDVERLNGEGVEASAGEALHAVA
ncbi:methionine ABC transporter ATP-binding protein [Labrys sp. KB_33_2]|uniref:methionine ABC transporter ATP-binding protein n=1 Tax=Labrys sp. KB_33_2 TaxID=3237479 RepID=UPI003F9133DF